MIKIDSILKTQLGREQIARALEHVSASGTEPICEELMLWLGIFGGLRAHEIFGLRLPAMLDADGRVADRISIDKHLAKYAPAREIPMPPRVREAVIRFRAAFPKAERISEGSGLRSTADVREWLNAHYSLIGFVQPTGWGNVYRLMPARQTLEPGVLQPANGANPSRVDERYLKPGTAKTKRASFRTADLVRAASAAQRVGLEITATEIGSDGSIRFSHKPVTPTSASAYDQWKERRDARRT